jgi:uncharacterized protein YbjT (DUF2867 family)
MADQLRVAVAGGTGLVGDATVHALAEAGHDVVVPARSRGVDLTTGAGVDDALSGVRAVIDVTNTPDTDPALARAFFETTTGELLAAGRRAGVGHHVALSIVGVDRVQGNGHYVGKRRQEELVAESSTPFTILRATQFFELAEMVLGWTTQDGAATIPPLLVQPIARSDVAAALAGIASTTFDDWLASSRARR